MSATLRRGTSAFLARYDRKRESLPGNLAVRDHAASLFRTAGLPSLRNEAWKYTSLRPLSETAFNEQFADLGVLDAELAQLPPIDAPRIVFVNGHLRDDLSDPLPGVTYGPFSGRAALRDLSDPARDPVVALNTMLTEDGATLSVSAGIDAGAIVLVNLSSNPHHRPIAFHPRHSIRLEAGAQLTIIELAYGSGVYLHNPVTTIEVGDGATLTHVRLQDESLNATHLSTIYAEIGGRGLYDAFTLNLGACLSRTEIHARVIGVAATVHLNGAQLLDGSQHGDITTVVRHDAPSCTSRQVVKSVLSGHSRGVFQGRIEVARIAQKTDGYQKTETLLLSPDAEIDCKPELEIYADDVKCSHGATVGELNADQLFYMRTRGIPEAEARSMLVHAFLENALSSVTDLAARAVLDAALAAWWARQG